MWPNTFFPYSLFTLKGSLTSGYEEINVEIVPTAAAKNLVYPTTAVPNDIFTCNVKGRDQRVAKK